MRVSETGSGLGHLFSSFVRKLFSRVSRNGYLCAANVAVYAREILACVRNVSTMRRAVLCLSGKVVFPVVAAIR